MSDFTYGYSEKYFGLPAPADGDGGWADEERRKAEMIGRLFQRLCDAVGEGVVSGGLASVVDGDVEISELLALIIDDLGAVPAEADAETLAGSLFPAGTSYVHCQLGETARTDGACGYLVSVSATPPADAIAICKVTKTGGVVTAVDNTIQGPPGVQARLNWEQIQANRDDATTLLTLLSAALGARYLAGEATPDLDTRMIVLETGGGGGGEGGGTVVSWKLLQKIAGTDPTTIEQEITAQLATHVDTYHQGGGGSGGTGDDTSSTVEWWDVDSLNQGRELLELTETIAPDLPQSQVDAITMVPGCYGDGSGADGIDYCDREHSTWLPEDD